MRSKRITTWLAKLITIAVAALPLLARAQYFTYYDDAEVLATFRKTGAFQGNYELVVNLGYITNFLNVAAGATIPVTAYTPSQLSSSFPDGYSDLQWAVFAAFAGDAAWNAGPWTFPPSTTWYTRPCTNATSRSATPNRFLKGFADLLRQQMLSLGDNAYNISVTLVTTNADNNTVLVREPISYTDMDVTAFIGDRIDPTLGDFRGAAFTYSVENTTPSLFSNPARTDLYQACPASDSFNKYVDPITGLTNGPAYFAGYFLLNPDGTMSFTRSTTNSVAVPPPAPRIVSVSHAGSASTIFFTTTNGATYTLYYTNAAGLRAPAATWPASPTTIVGNGSTASLSDTSTDPVRFYRVGVH